MTHPENKPEVAHGDGNTINNHVSNLRWATLKENQADRVLHGVDNRGERNGQCILTEEIVKKARELWIPYKFTVCMVAEKLGVSKRALNCALSGHTWSHIK